MTEAPKSGTKHLRSVISHELLQPEMCPIRLGIEAEHEAALEARDVGVQGRSHADTLLAQLRVLNARNAWIKHCQTCERCNLMLRK
jgi:hypothetical protein